MRPVFASLDFAYTPAPDVDAAVAHFGDDLGADLQWRVRAMGTTVAGGTAELGRPAGPPRWTPRR